MNLRISRYSCAFRRRRVSIWFSVGGRRSEEDGIRYCEREASSWTVAGREMVDAEGLVRAARIALKEPRGRDSRTGGVVVGDGGPSSSGVVTMMVTGAEGEFWKMVDEEDLFLRRRVRLLGITPEETYEDTVEVYADAMAMSTESFLRGFWSDTVEENRWGLQLL